MSRKELTYQEVREQHSEAWAGLPECYRDDTCLTFFLNVNGTLCAEHDLGECFVWLEEFGWSRDD